MLSVLFGCLKSSSGPLSAVHSYCCNKASASPGYSGGGARTGTLLATGTGCTMGMGNGYGWSKNVATLRKLTLPPSDSELRLEISQIS